MAKTKEKSNKLYGTGVGKNNITPNTSGLTNIGSKITTLNPDDDYKMIDAFNIDWESGEYKYSDDSSDIIHSTGHFVEIVKQKAAEAGSDILDDIKGNNYTTSQITIYRTNASTAKPPCSFGNSQVLNNENVRNYAKTTVYETIPEGWSKTLTETESNPYVFQSSIYEIRNLENDILGYHGPIGTVIYLPSENGLNGNFKSTVFCRINSTPDKPANGAYYDSGLPKTTKVFVGEALQEGITWSDGIPDGQAKLWATSAIISYLNNKNHLDNNAVWTDPKQMTDTATYDVEFSPYSNGTNTGPLVNPSNVDDTAGNRHNTSNKANQRWFDLTKDTTLDSNIPKIDENGQIPTNGGNTPTWQSMIWRAEREINNGEPQGNWVITRIKGEKGEGVKGDFKSTAFIRTNVDISNITPDGGDYNSPIPTSPITGDPSAQWSDGIPSGEKQLWSTWKTFSIGGNNSEWSKPIKVQDTQYYDVEFSFKTTKPDAPDDNNRHKESGYYAGQIWFDPTLDALPAGQTFGTTGKGWSDMIWRAEREIKNGDPQNWVITQIKGEDGIIPQPLPYYETRYTRTDTTSAPTIDEAEGQTPGDDFEYEGLTWSIRIPDNTDNPNVWQTSRKVVYERSNNTWSPVYEDDENNNWSEPFMLNGLPGEAQPIHPCLLYKWALSPASSNNYSPTVDLATNGIPSGWKESPDSPSDSTNIFLWMIQGEYKITNGNTRAYRPIEGNNYWTTPVCLSGADGQPGVDGDDIEFIYLCPTSTSPTTFDNVGSINVNSNNPANWYNADSTHHNVVLQYTPNRTEPLNNDYLGPSNVGWQDHPTGVDITHKYEYAAYRRTSKNANNQSYWEKFSTPFAWSIYGENGIDGDGIEYIYYRTGVAPSKLDVHPENWSTTATGSVVNGANYVDPQKDDYLGPKPNNVDASNWWTDEPSGVTSGSNQKYEYVSVRKKKFKEGSTTEKEWGKFSTPALWGNYAEDGLAVNMVLETDNDNITVGIDENGLVNGKYTDIANVYLKYNGKPKDNYDLTLSINNESTLNGTLRQKNNDTIIQWKDSTNTWKNIVTINNSSKTISVDIPQGMPIGQLNNILSIQLTATTNAQIDDIEAGTIFTKIFKITGVRLSIKDIYKLSLSTTAPHRNANNDGFESVTLRLKSYTSEASISTADAAKAKGLFVICNSTSKNTGTLDNFEWIVKNFDNITLPADFNKHTFTLYFKSLVNSSTTLNDNNISNLKTDAIWLDEEELSGVYDGNNGVDSRSEEYIYLLTSDIDFLTKHSSNYYVPSSWITSRDYQHDDYPFDNNPLTTSDGISYIKIINNFNGEGSIDTENSLVIAYWTDNPQGVSEQYPYEFRASRKYKTTNADGSRWLEFEKPVPWANWGHSGEDGDGVEYIYYRTSNVYSLEYMDVGTGDKPYKKFPGSWYSQSDYVNSEYIYYDNNNTGDFSDNPTGVNSTYKYEYVSIRKYKKLTYKDAVDYLKTQVLKYNGHGYTNFYDDKNLSISSQYDFEHSFNNLKGDLRGVGRSYINYENAYKLLEDIKNSYDNGTKYWSPYSYPTLWAKYGEQGSKGNDALTIEFDNPTIQIAVNSNGLIKDHQEVSTTIRAYVGSTPQTITSISLPSTSFNNSESPHILTQEKGGEKTQHAGYTITDNNKYTFSIGDIDTNNNGSLDSSDNISEFGYYDFTLLDTLSIPFTITIGSTEYTKYLNVAPIHFGQDGQDAETFELFAQNSTIHYNPMLDDPAPEPESLKYQIKHIKGLNPVGGDQIIKDLSDINNYISQNDGGELTLWYKLNVEREQNTSPDYVYQGHEGGSTTIPVSGIFDATTGSAIGVEQTAGTQTTNNPSNLDGTYTNVDVIPVTTVTTSEESVLNALDSSLEFGTLLENNGHVNYDNTSIDSVVNELTGLQTELQETLSNTEDSDERTAIEEQITNVGTILDTLTDTVDVIFTKENDEYVVNSGYETIYVVDTRTQVETVSKDIAVREYTAREATKEQEISTPVAPISDNENTGTHKKTGGEENKDNATETSADDSSDPEGNKTQSTPKLMGAKGGESNILGEGWYSFNSADPNNVDTLYIKTLYFYRQNKSWEENQGASPGDTVKSIEVALLYTAKDGNQYVWDKDLLEIISDGINGVDGDSIEYIYYLSTDTTQPTFQEGNVKNSDPRTWETDATNGKNNKNFQDNDYVGPLNSGWSDHPQGVSSTNTWEYISQREKTTVISNGQTIKKWGSFSIPQPWSHFGENGRDGDGVEYIFAVGTNPNWKISTGVSNADNTEGHTQYDPRRWFFNEANISLLTTFQNTVEYIPSSASIVWKDDPITNLQVGQYQFASIRKYITVTQNYINNLTANDIGYESSEYANAYLTSIKSILQNNYLCKKIWLPYSEPTIWSSNIKGADGAFKSTVFKRNATQPSKPANGADYSTGLPLTPNGWSDGIPSATGTTILPIWASSATITPSNASSVGWSTPRLMADTELYDVEFAFEQTGDAIPNEPANTNRHGGSGTQIWFDPTLDKNSLPSGKTWSDMVWRAEREKTPGTDTYSKWTITRIKGEKGNPGNDGNDAYTIDWTNDQINLAVDENGYIIGGENGQLKETSININSLNGVFGSNPTIKLKWLNENGDAEEEHPTNKLKKNSSDINNVYVLDHLNNTNVTFYHNSENVLKIKVGAGYSGKAYISPEGIELKTHVRIYNGSTLKLHAIKILRICGQHIAQDGQDGQNAVTYEIVPSTNAINYTTQSNITISYVVNKYDGNTITQLSSEDFNKSPLYLNASWSTSNGTTISYNSTFNSIYYLASGGSIDLKLWKGQENSSDAVLLDTETIPVLKNGVKGEAGSQGFTGPIVRFAGEFDPSTYYSDGTIRTGQSTSSNNYSETDGPRYIDIVIHENQYWKCKGHMGFKSLTSNGITKNTGYVLNKIPSSISSYWENAQNFDFVATKLLYADQALINQISTHDLIATNSVGYPVAGVTSGSKMYDKNNDEIVSYLSTLGDVNYSENSVSSQNDPSNVRIFAGEIYNSNENSYSLTYAPFNVRQDGTTYMTKANIIGDVNIGGNVNIWGNAKVCADMSVNTLTLNTDSFKINSDCTLPVFNENEHKMLYILIHHNLANTNYYLIPQEQDKLLVTQNNSFKSLNAGEPLLLDNHALYTSISTYIENISYWIVTKTAVFDIPTNIPATAQINFNESFATITKRINTGGTFDVTVKIDPKHPNPDGYEHFHTADLTVRIVEGINWRVYGNSIYSDTSKPVISRDGETTVSQYQYDSTCNIHISSLDKNFSCTFSSEALRTIIPSNITSNVSVYNKTGLNTHYGNGWWKATTAPQVIVSGKLIYGRND